MDRCDECKHKNICVGVPYGCECFELDLEEHDKQIRADEREKVLNETLEKIIEVGDAFDWVEIRKSDLLKIFDEMKQ